jgi:hypothetical protein
VCAMFLSRQYSVVLFVWLALSGGYVQVMTSLATPPPRLSLQLTRIAAITAGGVLSTYVMVRFFGNWTA